MEDALSADTACQPPSRFWELLNSLGAEHKRELQSLRAELQGEDVIDVDTFDGFAHDGLATRPKTDTPKLADKNKRDNHTCEASQRMPRVPTRSHHLTASSRPMSWEMSHRLGPSSADESLSPRHENSSHPLGQRTPESGTFLSSAGKSYRTLGSKVFVRQQTWETAHHQGQQWGDATASASVPSRLRAALSRSGVFSEAPSECQISFVLRDAWNEPLSDGNLIRHTTTHRYQRQRSDLGDQISSVWKKLYLSPGSPLRLGWGSCSLLLLLYDVATIPMLVFDPPETQPMTVAAWITQIFWTIDLVSNFFVGYYDKGSLIMSPPRIALRYLRTTFILDLTIVGIDWAFYAIGDGEESSAGLTRLVKTGRALRVFRMVRLFRLVRTQQFLQQVNRFISSEIASVRCGIMKLFIQLCLLSHLIACGWYGIAVVKGIDSRTWVQAAGITDAPFEYRYITSLHCTLAQLGVGATNIVPTNFLEAVYAVFVMFLAIIAVSSLIGSITTLMALLQSTRGEETHDFWLLKKFCVDHEISKDLSDRVRQYIEYIQHRKHRVNDTDVPLFRMLTEPLQLELQYERYAPRLKPHQFFRKLITSSYLESRRNGSSNVMQRVCNDSVSSIPLARQDVLFCAGEDASRMYVLDDGDLDYDHGGDLQKVGFAHWISEAALWTSWIHVGELHARTECQLIALDAARFSGIIARHPDLWALAKKYAEHFVLMLNSTDAEDLSDLSEEGLDHIFTSKRPEGFNFRLFRLTGQ